MCHIVFLYTFLYYHDTFHVLPTLGLEPGTLHLSSQTLTAWATTTIYWVYSHGGLTKTQKFEEHFEKKKRLSLDGVV